MFTYFVDICHIILYIIELIKEEEGNSKKIETRNSTDQEKIT